MTMRRRAFSRLTAFGPTPSPMSARRREFDLPSAVGQVDPQPAEVGVVGAIRLLQPDQQIEPPLPFQHLRNDFALQRRLHDLADVLARHAVAGQVIGPQPDVQFRRLLNRLDDRRRHARQRLESRAFTFSAVASSVSRSSPTTLMAIWA